MIVRGNQALAIAYAVHVLDLYDHYVFRARIEQNLRDNLASGTIHALADGQDSGDPGGLLKLDSSWQDAHFAPDRPHSTVGTTTGHPSVRCIRRNTQQRGRNGLSAAADPANR